MLLQSLYEFHQLRKDESTAFTKKNIKWIIPLTIDGKLEAKNLLETEKDRLFRVPSSSRPKNAGGIAEFLWDGIEAIFCLKPDFDLEEKDPKKRERQEQNRKRKFDDFWLQIQTAYNKEQLPYILALLKFKERYIQERSVFECFRWGIAEGTEPNGKANWWIKTTIGEKKFNNENFSFQVEGKILLDDPLLQQYWEQVFAQEKETKAGNVEKGICLVTGQTDVAISDSHLPKIKKVPGTVSSGAALVSFDKAAFRSYGFDKSYNSPVSLVAVEAYCNTLNKLLEDKKHSLRIGDIAICFWAKNSGNDQVTDLFSELFEQPSSEQIRNLLNWPLKADSQAPEIKDDLFYSVTLTGTGGRVVVRHWLQITIKQAVDNFQKWFKDLEIFHNEKDFPQLGLYRLASTTINPQSKDKTPLPELVSQLYRAALDGTVPSLLLAKKILDRFYIDLAKNGSNALRNIPRFSLLKLISNRNRKESELMIEPQLCNTTDTAYNCGRLLAIFDNLQAAAHEYGLEGATIVERYYGSASSSPNSAFPILWRLHIHHLRKLAQQGEKAEAKAKAIKSKIAEIVALFQQIETNLPPQFPRFFDLRAQVRFALGFYQQKAADEAARKAVEAAKKAAKELATTKTQPTEPKEGHTNE